MRVGDLVTHVSYKNMIGIVVAVCDDHWETRLPSADVLWSDDLNILCHSQNCLEVICK